MREKVLYAVGKTPALRCAAAHLSAKGFRIVTSPGPDVTHLLLPVPSLDSNGRIIGVGSLWHLLSDLPRQITVIGGNLHHPALQDYDTLDLLQDPVYLNENAAITADCAIRVAAIHLRAVFRGCPVLVIGWGRIGKQLANLLRSIGSEVTIAARKEADRATAQSLGLRAIEITDIAPQFHRFVLIFNTAPAQVLSIEEQESPDRSPVCIDLASRQGIMGENVVIAKGLPGKLTPDSSGALIAETVLRLVGAKEASI